MQRTVLLFIWLFAAKAIYAQSSCYTVSQIPYSPDPYNLGNSVQLGDDEFSTAIPIGFDFCFFGITYDHLIIGSNGIVSFDTSLAETNCAYGIGNAIPSDGEIDALNTIMGPWQDINPSAGGGINHATYGIAPYRRFVVSYNEVPMYSCSDSVFSNQVVIYEGSNTIDISVETKFVCPAHNNGAAILGIQDTSGTEAYWANDWNFPTQWEAFELAYRFNPVCYCQKESASNQISGKVYVVNDLDCLPEVDEIGIPNHPVHIEPGISIAWTDPDGNYVLTSSNDQFEIVQAPVAGMDQVCPFTTTYEFDTTAQGALITDVNFGNVVTDACADLTVSMGNSGIGNCETTTHTVQYCNTGNSPISNVQVALELSEYAEIIESSIPYNVLGGGSEILFEIGVLSPFQCGTFSFTDSIACGFGAGNTLCYNLVILPNSGDDCNGSNNQYFNCQETQASSTSNHKFVRSLEAGSELVDQTTWVYDMSNLPVVEYVIRFQNNTGETQQNLWVVDSLPTLLNVNTLEVLSSSHAYNLSYNNGSLQFNFVDINLPTASQEPEESKGFIYYRIRVDSSVTEQSSIPNSATIHFGENDSENTNTAVINVLPNSIPEESRNEILIFPNPANDRFWFKGVSKCKYTITDLQGRQLQSGIFQGNQAVNLSTLPKGTYLIGISTSVGIVTERLVRN